MLASSTPNTVAAAATVIAAHSLSPPSPVPLAPTEPTGRTSAKLVSDLNYISLYLQLPSASTSTSTSANASANTNASSAVLCGAGSSIDLGIYSVLAQY